MELLPHMCGSTLWPKYGETADRESAYEKLAARTGADAKPTGAPEPAPEAERRPEKPAKEDDAEEGWFGKIMKSPFAKQIAREATQEIVRGVFGTARRRR